MELEDGFILVHKTEKRIVEIHTQRDLWKFLGSG